MIMVLYYQLEAPLRSFLDEPLYECSLTIIITKSINAVNIKITHNNYIKRRGNQMFK